MPRVREIEDDGGEPTLEEIFERERAVFGGLLNTTKVLAHCPPVLRAAKQSQPDKPHAIYYEAVALSLSGETEAAIQAYRSARVVASQASERRFEARALQGAAQLLERTPARRSEAIEAWNELEAFLGRAVGAGVEGVGKARVERIQAAAEAEATGAEVQRRQAAREEEVRQREAEKAAKKKKR